MFTDFVATLSRYESSVDLAKPIMQKLERFKVGRIRWITGAKRKEQHVKHIENNKLRDMMRIE